MNATDGWQAGWRRPDRGALLVLGGPSGAGKSTLSTRAVATIPGLSFSVSFTSRPRAENETDGVHYHFVTREYFEDLVRRGAMLEWVELYGNYYGTALDRTRGTLRYGDALLMEVNDKGVDQIRKHQLDVVTIFVMPPSLAALRQRLVDRGRETPEKIELRMAEAAHELQRCSRYDYLIMNDHLPTAHMRLQSIIIAELSRRGNQHGLLAQNDERDFLP